MFICEVVVWILLTFCSFRVFVSSNFIVISACSSLPTSFLKSKCGSRVEEGCDDPFLLLNVVIEVLESSFRFLSFLCFYNHGY